MDYELMMNGNVKIGEQAPEFTADSTIGEINLGDYKEKWIVLFSYPGDFTAICTKEIIAFSNKNTYFKKQNTFLIGLSVDSKASHFAWLNDIYARTGVKVPFPIIADRNGEIARKYGMISNSISNAETTNNVYIIDDKGYIRAFLAYPMTVERSIPEIIRIIDSLQKVDSKK